MGKNENQIEWAYRLFYSAMLKGTVTALTNAVYKILQWPVIIVDNFTTKICQVPNKALGIADWDYMLKNGISHQEHYLKFNEKYYANLSPKEYPMIIHDGFQEASRQYINIIFNDNKPLVQVIMHIPSEKISDEERKIHAMFCQCLKSIILRKEEKEIYLNKNRTDSLYRLLSGEPLTDVNSKDIGILNKDLFEDYIVMVSVFDAIEYDSRTIGHAKKEIENRFTNTVTTIIEDNIITLCSNLKKDDKIGSENIMRGVCETFESYNMLTGVSTKFSNLAMIKVYYHQAVLTLKAGRKISPQITIYHFEDYLPYQMLLDCVEKYKMETFLHPILVDIKKYDKKYNKEYYKTLEVFVLSYLNYNEAQKKLSIHHNTLLYRLDKIKELFNVDQKNTALILAFQSNFLAIRLKDNTINE